MNYLFTEYDLYHTGSLKLCATDSIGMRAKALTRSLLVDQSAMVSLPVTI